MAEQGLPDALVQAYADRGIRQLYEWQAECLAADGVAQGKNLVYCAPTSGGKTLVSEVLMLRRAALQKKRAIFVLPYVSIVSEKSQYLQQLCRRARLVVKGFYGGSPNGIRDLFDIAVCTIEKANALVNMLAEEKRLAEGLGTLVVDELHLVGDESRGYLLELVLSKVLNLAPSVQIVGLSATLPNVEDIARWLKAVLYQTSYRPVPLQEYLLVDGSTVLDKKGSEVRAICRDGFSQEALMSDKTGMIAATWEVVREGHSALIFCSSKLKCEQAADMLAKWLPVAQHEAAREGARTALVEELQQQVNGIDPTLRRTLLRGVSYHHSGLAVEERAAIERRYVAGDLSVICATSTLAAGVNLPARRVIFQTPYMGNAFLDSTQYKQMAGRAGRAGQGNLGESILIAPRPQLRPALELVAKTLPQVASCLGGARRGLMRLLLEVLTVTKLGSGEDLIRFCESTLLTTQKASRELTGDPMKDYPDIADAMTWLLKHDMVRLDERVHAYGATPLGRAVCASGMEPSEGYTMWQELEKARPCISMDTDLHVCYLATPPDDRFKVEWTVFSRALRHLSPAERKVAQRVGVRLDLVDLAEFHGGRLPQKVLASLDGFRLQRFYRSLVLWALLHETPVPTLLKQFGVARGHLQQLQQGASSFTATLAIFCNKLQWYSMEALVNSFQQRLTFGVRSELVPLMQIPNMDCVIARMLYEHGFTTPVGISSARPVEILRILRKTLPHDTPSAALPEANAERLIEAAKGTAKEDVKQKRRLAREATKRQKAERAEPDPSGAPPAKRQRMSSRTPGARRSAATPRGPRTSGRETGDDNDGQAAPRMPAEPYGGFQPPQPQHPHGQQHPQPPPLPQQGVAEWRGSARQPPSVQRAASAPAHVPGQTMPVQARNQSMHLQQRQNAAEPVPPFRIGVRRNLLPELRGDALPQQPEPRLHQMRMAQQPPPLSHAKHVPSQAQAQQQQQQDASRGHGPVPWRQQQVHSSAGGPVVGGLPSPAQQRPGIAAATDTSSGSALPPRAWFVDTPASQLRLDSDELIGGTDTLALGTAQLGNDVDMAACVTPSRAAGSPGPGGSPLCTPERLSEGLRRVGRRSLTPKDVEAVGGNHLQQAAAFPGSGRRRVSVGVSSGGAKSCKSPASSSASTITPGGMRASDVTVITFLSSSFGATQSPLALPTMEVLSLGHTLDRARFSTCLAAQPFLGVSTVLAAGGAEALCFVMGSAGACCFAVPPAAPEGTSKLPLDIAHALRCWFADESHLCVTPCAKELCSSLLRQGVDPCCAFAEPRIAQWLTDPDDKQQVTTAELAAQAAVRPPQLQPGAAALMGEGLTALDGALRSRLSAEWPEAFLSLPLAAALIRKLEAQLLLDSFWDIEMPISVVLAWMEHFGLACDSYDPYHTFSHMLYKMAALDEQVKGLVGRPVQMSSGEDVGRALFEDLKIPLPRGVRFRMKNNGRTAFRSPVDLLKQLPQHPVVDHVLEHRHLAHAARRIEALSKSGGPPLPEPLCTKCASLLVSTPPGVHRQPHPLQPRRRLRRVRTEFMQTATATGRLATAAGSMPLLSLENPFEMREVVRPSVHEELAASAGSMLTGVEPGSRIFAAVAREAPPRERQLREGVLRSVETATCSDPLPGTNESLAAYWLTHGWSAYSDEAHAKSVRQVVVQHGSSTTLSYPADKVWRLAAPVHVDESGANKLTVNPRRMLVAEAGYVLLSVDYSQLEVRLMAHFSQDKRFVEILQKKGDVFRHVAAGWLRKSEAEVSAEERSGAKRICYGILYGVGAARLALELGITRVQAQEFQNSFMREFEGVAQWIQSCRDKARTCGYVETLGGRRRFLPALAANERRERSHAERQAVNTACQASAADLVKTAMLSIHAKLKALRSHSYSGLVAPSPGGRSGSTPAAAVAAAAGGQSAGPPAVAAATAGAAHGGCVAAAGVAGCASAGGAGGESSMCCGMVARMLLQVHDELLFEVEEARLDEVREVIVSEMILAGAGLRVPMQVKWKVGRSWGEMAEVSVPTQ